MFSSRAMSAHSDQTFSWATQNAVVHSTYEAKCSASSERITEPSLRAGLCLSWSKFLGQKSPVWLFERQVCIHFKFVEQRREKNRNFHYVPLRVNRYPTSYMKHMCVPRVSLPHLIPLHNPKGQQMPSPDHGRTQSLPYSSAGDCEYSPCETSKGHCNWFFLWS